MISREAYLLLVDDALDGLAAILRELGDEGSGRRLDVPGANSPYAVVTHCLGVVEYWAGHVVHGRASERDRDGEFLAAGRIDPLLEQLERARRQLAADVALAEPGSPPAITPPGLEPAAFARLVSTQGGVLLHVYTELAQHLGQLEVTRDVLLAESEHL
jgi:Protein of unknown function (DUF664)